MCKIFKVSTSGYYLWLKGVISKRWFFNEKLSVLIQHIFKGSFESYGAPRIKTALEEFGYYVSIPKVARIMRALGLYAQRTRKFKVTTDSKHNYPVAPNVLAQNFKVVRSNQVWVSDITYIETKQGWMYLTVVIDLFNRKVVGWSMSDNLTTESTILPAFRMASESVKLTEELIFHSDRGSQYASSKFKNLLKTHNGLIIQSMSRKGNCWDNAVAESFFKSLKVEWVYKHKYNYRSEAELSVFQWIETWYNRRRIHSTLGNKSIMQFEKEMNQYNVAA